MMSKLDEEHVNLPEFDTKTDSKFSEIQVNIKEITGIVHILDPNKVSDHDVISH